MGDAIGERDEGKAAGLQYIALEVGLGPQHVTAGV